MKRLAVSLSVLVCAAVVPSVAPAQPAHGTVTGTITYVGTSVLTIQTGGRTIGVVNAMTRAANALTTRFYPYVYGGGHREAGIASVGIKGPGHNGRRVGYDCSGSVAAVLAGAGLWPPGSGVPSDAGVIRQLLQDGVIARGPGAAPSEVTLYDRPGAHMFMNIDGRFFGTSDGGAGNPKGGPGWLYDGAPDARSTAYKRYHVLPSVLRSQTSYGESFTFQTDASPSVTAGAETGDKVRIAYVETPSGAMTATAVQYLDALTASGTVTAIAPDGSTMAIQTMAGPTLSFVTSSVSELIAGLQPGAGLQVTYTKDASGRLVAHALQILSPPNPQAAAGAWTPSPPSQT